MSVVNFPANNWRASDASLRLIWNRANSGAARRLQNRTVCGLGAEDIAQGVLERMIVNPDYANFTLDELLPIAYGSGDHGAIDALRRGRRETVAENWFEIDNAEWLTDRLSYINYQRDDVNPNAAREADKKFDAFQQNALNFLAGITQTRCPMCGADEQDCPEIDWLLQVSRTFLVGLGVDGTSYGEINERTLRQTSVACGLSENIMNVQTKEGWRYMQRQVICLSHLVYLAIDAGGGNGRHLVRAAIKLSQSRRGPKRWPYDFGTDW